MATDSLSLSPFSFFHFHPRPRVTSSNVSLLLGQKASRCSMKPEARFTEEFSSPTTYCCTRLYWHLVFRPQAANCGSSRRRDCESPRKSFFNQERLLHSKTLAGKKKTPQHRLTLRIFSHQIETVHISVVHFPEATVHVDGQM